VTQVVSFCPLLRVKFRTLVASGALAPLSACPPAASSTSSTPLGFSTEIQSDSISVRNFSTTETENHRLAFKRHQLIIKRHCRSVGVERAPRTLPTRCVPRSSPIRPTACPSFRPRPATARPRALRLATLLRGAGLERCWWCHTGKTHWKAVQGGSEVYGCRCSNG
jgi:hypothetical protein